MIKGVFLLLGTKTLSTNLNNRIVKIFESQSTSGYLVSRNYAQNLIGIFLKSINMMESYRYLDSIISGLIESKAMADYMHGDPALFDNIHLFSTTPDHQGEITTHI